MHRNESTKTDELYTVQEIAKLLKVHDKTIKRWLGLDAPELAVISADDWFKLPGGRIRIFERALLKLQGHYY